MTELTDSKRRATSQIGQDGKKELANTKAFCGLACGLCGHRAEGCRGGGGDGDCHQHRCCLERRIGGCWLCDAFPCDEGYFADEAWEGLCTGFVRSIRDEGIEEFVGLVRSKLGKEIDYGSLRFKREQEIVAMLRDAPFAP